MAPQQDLVKDVLDVFAMIDAGAGLPPRPATQIFVHKVCRPNQEPVMNHEEAAKRFGGIVIKERFNTQGGNRGIGGLQK